MNSHNFIEIELVQLYRMKLQFMSILSNKMSKVSSVTEYIVLFICSLIFKGK